MKKILVPTDFSRTASHALDFALDFNDIIGGRIILIHVLELPNYSFGLADGMILERPEDFFNTKFINEVEEHLEEWSLRVSSAGQEVDFRLKYGNPYQNISQEIANEKTDWIIMGSRGASGLREILLGSNAERVIRYSGCPVITIKGPTKIADMKNIVFASDLSEEQDWMAYKAKVIQQLLGLEMNILKVKTPHNFLNEHIIQNQLKDFADRNHFKNATLNTIEASNTDQGIIEFAKKIHAGLIVIGTHDKTRLSFVLGGSKAEDLANHSKIPILTFKLPHIS